MTTASRKATAFSLIRMVGVSLFCCGWGAGAIAEGGERGNRPGLSIIYTAARNFQSQKRLKIIRHRNRKRQSPAGRLGAASSRRGHQFRGGSAVAASLSLLAGAEARAMTGRRASSGGERWPVLPVGRRATGTCDPYRRRCVLADRAGWRGTSRRIAQDAKWYPPGAISNAKTPSRLAQIATN